MIQAFFETIPLWVWLVIGYGPFWGWMIWEARETWKKDH